MRRSLLIFLVSRAMLAVLLLTVFAPGFGWEAAAGVATHHEFTQGDADFQDHGDHGRPAGHDEPVQYGGHGCAGHLFSHLAILPGPAGPAIDDARRDAAPSLACAMCSLLGKQSEHPPKSSPPARFAHEPADRGRLDRRQPASWRNSHVEESIQTSASRDVPAPGDPQSLVSAPPCVSLGGTTLAAAAAAGSTSTVAWR